jgi:hypothetical protein
MSVDPDAGWHNRKVLIIFAVIFICGIACGGAVVDLYMHSKIMRTPPSVHKLEDDLHMNAEQRRAVEHELDEYAKYYQNIEEERESVAEQGKRNILRVLTPEQQKRFSQLFQFPTAAPCTHDSPAAN